MADTPIDAVELFFIVDVNRTRVSESVVFWREKGHGYTVNVNDAGRYTIDDPEVRRFDEQSTLIPVAAFDPARFVTVAVKSQLADAMKRGITHDEIARR